MRTKEENAEEPLLRESSHSLSDLAHKELHRMITDGELVVGQRLIIDQFATRFGTSPIPIREALARLRAERLVTFVPNKGYSVAPAPSATELKEMFDARLALELGALELTGGAPRLAIINKMRHLNQTMAGGKYGKTYASISKFVDLNAEFHNALMELSGNRFLIEAYKQLAYHQRIIQVLYGRGVPDIRRIVTEHDEIIAALTANDPDHLRRMVRSHIIDGAARLQGD